LLELTCFVQDFSIAKAVIKSPKNKLSLSPEALEDICLSCSRELYDNASSGNYTFGDMKLAYEWYVFIFFKEVQAPITSV
jgi:hypothetical protein